ncbi:MAG: amino acid--tRNA ligase-related protein [Patescibacteria group bacterium]|mgnify:CR=1 FL=1
MASIDEIRETRIKKLQALEKRGVNPYPTTAHYDKTLFDASKNFKEEESLGLVGRIMGIRGQGKIVFFDFDDGTGKFQALLKKGEPTKEEDFELFTEFFDIGDFIEVKGTLFLTKQNEKTILVESLRMLSKSLRPLPEKWHGLSDTEERFRRRYLDLISNPEVKRRFVLRTMIVSEIRKILDESGFLEVETPVLQSIYGGASAEPFATHHNALGKDFFLRISDELYLKRLMAGGFQKVYEIARDFRNEGIDTTHNPEFTMLEFYEAYSDATKQRAFVEQMMKRLSALVPDCQINFGKPFVVKKYMDLITEKTGIKDLFKHSSKELDDMFKKIRPEIIEPTFVVDYPVDMLPLTKRKEGDKNLVDAFQLYAGGIELAKAFSELNDPIDQRARFEKQEKNKKEGDKEAQLLDEDFLEAMEYGIPPAGGVGIGIDRLVMLLTGVKNIKEVILFPTLKPRD